MNTQILLIKNTPEVVEYLVQQKFHEAFYSDRDRACSYRYVMMHFTDTYYRFRTAAAKKQYHPRNMVIGDINTLHQITLLKSLGLKDQEIWNQLKELT